MKKWLIAIYLLVLAVPVFAKEPVRVIEGTVTKVSDGDTIQVTDTLGTKVKVRMYGIDAPETQKGNTSGQPYGEESFQALRRKVERQRVRLDVMDIDRYKRLVSIAWLSERNINKEMISDGYAWAYRKYLDRAYASEWISDEEHARMAKRGLWLQGGNIQPPWEFRTSLNKRINR